MTSREPFPESEGFRFVDRNHGPMFFVQRGPYTGWLCTWHPDGFWKTLRLANPEDMEAIAKRIAVGN